MNRSERLEVLAQIKNAPDYASEQAALARAVAIVDILPSLPKGAADLHHQFDPAEHPDLWMDYASVCRGLGLGWDRGARRYVIHAKNTQTVVKALEAEGFVVAVGLGVAAAE